MTIGTWGRGDADPQGGRAAAGRSGRALCVESGGADGLGVSPGDRKEPDDRPQAAWDQGERQARREGRLRWHRWGQGRRPVWCVGCESSVRLLSTADQCCVSRKQSQDVGINTGPALPSRCVPTGPAMPSSSSREGSQQPAPPGGPPVRPGQRGDGPTAYCPSRPLPAGASHTPTYVSLASVSPLGRASIQPC